MHFISNNVATKTEKAAYAKLEPGDIPALGFNVVFIILSLPFASLDVCQLFYKDKKTI